MWSLVTGGKCSCSRSCSVELPPARGGIGRRAGISISQACWNCNRKDGLKRRVEESYLLTGI